MQQQAQAIPGLDPDKLQQYLAAALAAISPAMIAAVEGDVQRQAVAAQKGAQQTGIAQSQGREEGHGSGFGGEQPPRHQDAVVSYEQQSLEDGRVVKRYPDGTVRVENPTTGLIQEERKDGTFLVSLPGGRLLYQAFPGDPLLAYDLNENNRAPIIAQVAMTNLPGKFEPSLVYTFSTGDGLHVVDAEGLRYFKSRTKPTAGVQATPGLGPARMKA